MRLRVPTRRALSGTAVALGLLVTGGCASSSEPVASPATTASSSPTPSPTPTPDPPRWENERLLLRYGTPPFEVLDHTKEENREILDAIAHLTETCMSALGYEPKPDLPPSAQRDAPGAVWDEHIGLVDPELAATYGYSPPLDEEYLRLSEERRKAQEARKAQYDTPERTEAEYGAGGCSIQAIDALREGDFPEVDWELVHSLEDTAIEQTWTDAAVGAAVEAWRACMTEAGYAFDWPPLVESHITPMTPELMAQAVADVTCKQSSGLVDAFISTLYAKQRALLDEHADQVALVEESNRVYLQKARDAVES